MKALSKVVSALSFAHLASLGRRAARAEVDDKPAERDHEDTSAKKAEKRDDETDDEYANRMKADDESQDAKAECDDKDEPKAEDEDQDAKAEVDEKDDEDKPKGKAKVKAEDDDKDEEMRGSSAAASARRREQARCAAIFASASAARNPVLAANLAFKTRMSRAESLALLEATPGAAAQSNTVRSARNPNVSTGGSAQPTTAQASASSWDRAFKAVAPRR